MLLCELYLMFKQSCGNSKKYKFCTYDYIISNTVLLVNFIFNQRPIDMYKQYLIMQKGVINSSENL